jgi:BirA family biotin operon repressor/biotin-[acetyl-CoA-carboxylase] ligase
MSILHVPAPFSLIWLDSVGSRNDEARRLAREGAAADLLVVAAATQTAGRGRRGRQWVSPPGNLHCSTLIRLDGPLAEAAQIGFVAAVALCEALGELAPAEFRCKWPNDVLCDGKKIAGMLLEPEDGWLVLGLGVDVVEAPAEVLYPATSLAEAGGTADAAAVLEAFCRRFLPWLQRWRAEGFAPIRAAWLERSKGLGEATVVRLEGDTLTGTFAGLDGEGALLLDDGAGKVRRVMAGDVFFPR